MNDQRPDPTLFWRPQEVTQSTPNADNSRFSSGLVLGRGRPLQMLQSARQAQDEGVRSGIGIAETHGRKETEVLIDGFAILPRKTLPAMAGLVTEFDLDGAPGVRLQAAGGRRAAPLPNVAGSRHAKRWQDVEELLDAGVDVGTALNVLAPRQPQRHRRRHYRHSRP